MRMLVLLWYRSDTHMIIRLYLLYLYIYYVLVWLFTRHCSNTEQLQYPKVLINLPKYFEVVGTGRLTEGVELIMSFSLGAVCWLSGSLRTQPTALFKTWLAWTKIRSCSLSFSLQFQANSSIECWWPVSRWWSWCWCAPWLEVQDVFI